MAELPRLFVHAAILERWDACRARPWEVGGWLLGWWAEDGESLLVTHATPPASRGTPFGVTISGRGHRPYFDAAWDASGGHVTFLGDWHTHPGGPPLPSSRDRAAATRLAEDEDFGTPEPLIAIVSTPRWLWSARGTTPKFYVRRGGELLELEPYRLAALPAAAAAVPAWPW